MAANSIEAAGERTAALVDFAATTSYGDVPDAVVDRAKLTLLDTVGSLLAAAQPRHDPGRLLAEFVADVGGTPESTVVGYGQQSSCVNAAFANGTMGYYCDLDAHHPEAITHTPAIVVPAALAVGEREGASGEQFLAATVLGIEMACRVSLALGPDTLYERGFHPTPVSGSFGAAVAAGKLFEFDPREYLIALGLAQTQTGGSLAWKQEPTESVRPFNPGVAARNGVTAALLARSGFGSPVDPFEGEYDVFRAFSDGEGAPERLDRGLGETYAITDHAFKQYSSVAFSHTGLDALVALLSDHDVAPGEIQRIEVRFPATGAELIDDTRLKSHSLRYLLAVAAVDRTVTIDDIVTDRTADPEVAGLMDRVELVPDEKLDREFPERYPSILELETAAGTYSKRVDYAKGTPEKPFERSDVVDKFHRLTDDSLSRERRGTIVETVEQVPALEDVGELAALLE